MSVDICESAFVESTFFAVCAANNFVFIYTTKDLLVSIIDFINGMAACISNHDDYLLYVITLRGQK